MPINRFGLTGLKSRFAAGVLSGLVCVLYAVNAHSKGAPTTLRSRHVFRELIVQGERPEIAACMAAAVAFVRRDAKFDAVRWADDVSDSAYMRETEGGIHVSRTVRFKAQLRDRAHGFFSETWARAEITCEQRDEEAPEVRFAPLK